MAPFMRAMGIRERYGHSRALWALGFHDTVTLMGNNQQKIQKIKRSACVKN